MYDVDKIRRGDIVVFNDPDNWLTVTEPTGLHKIIQDALVALRILPANPAPHLLKRDILVAGGRASCHETTTKAECVEKLRQGVFVFMREGSTQKNMAECIRAVTEDGLDSRRCILATDDGDRWLPRFRNDFNLLVEADYGNINPEEELPTYVEETNFTSEGKGLYLGINFAGKGNADIIDRPQVFARILLKNAEGTPYRSLKMFFRQKSATELCFNRALLTKENGDTVESVSTHQEGNRLTVENVTAEIRFFSDEKDFRNSGKIHIDGSHPIDRDPGFLL